jgi:hypothetical protein
VRQGSAAGSRSREERRVASKSGEGGRWQTRNNDESQLQCTDELARESGRGTRREKQSGSAEGLKGF